MNLISADILSSDESHRRDVYLQRYYKGMHGFMDAGLALKGLNEERLYRDKYRTFAEFCQQECKISRATAYRLIQTATAAKNILELAPAIEPTCEHQMIPLTRLAPHLQRQIWVSVTQDKSLGQKIDVKEIKSAVAKIVDPGPAPKSSGSVRFTERIPTPATNIRPESSEKNMETISMVMSGYREFYKGIEMARDGAWSAISKEEVVGYVRELEKEALKAVDSKWKGKNSGT